MGIYDREYYRGETRGNLWLSGAAPVCRALIAINIVVFLAEMLGILNQEFVRDWLVNRPSDVLQKGYVWELLTGTFLHGGPLHLLMNMVCLWFVGQEMEAMYGSKDFAIFYVSAGIISSLGSVFYHLATKTLEVPSVGASGAISAVMVLYALYYPQREILVFFIPMKMWALVAIFFGADLLMILSHNQYGIAAEAHVAGAVYGYLFKRFDLRWSHLKRFRSPGRRLRVIYPDAREKTTPRSTITSPGPTWAPNQAGSSKPSAVPAASIVVAIAEEQLDARLDEILAKIAREGRGGLTEDENRVLQEASIRARNRRSDRV